MALTGTVGETSIHIGLDSSMRRPTELTMRSMIRNRCESSLKRHRPVRACRGARCRLVESVDEDIRISGSARSSSRGPSPNSSLRTSETSDCRSKRLSGTCALSHQACRPETPRISGSASSRLTRVRRSRFNRFSSPWCTLLLSCWYCGWRVSTRAAAVGTGVIPASVSGHVRPVSRPKMLLPPFCGSASPKLSELVRQHLQGPPASSGCSAQATAGVDGLESDAVVDGSR